MLWENFSILCSVWQRFNRPAIHIIQASMLCIYADLHNFCHPTFYENYLPTICYIGTLRTLTWITKYTDFCRWEILFRCNLRKLYKLTTEYQKSYSIKCRSQLFAIILKVRHDLKACEGIFGKSSFSCFSFHDYTRAHFPSIAIAWMCS